ncbi:FAD/NAD(P)-binding domain-containing protein [Coniochaeta ligniaria NRRL 30616]|uniref:FAD/NAD(P)-binding domain-containing protein n=1 Tax=Coniochaeta ligniaria NRRL 30616 TaxID=1408157 RepID=A0A1J7IWC4_9PEZI|nr:FAD/NAD(P)-binding domain-containing protein [Coniochaeta ligniaria NRRL 30616]
MPITQVLILGAGPAGLSTALSISQIPSSPPIRVTILELRPATVTTASLGGAVNLTPPALRYLDRLGVGAQLRRTGIPVGAVENVSLRTGRLLGALWRGVDGVRVMRSGLVACMRGVVAGREGVEVRYGVRVVEIREEGTGTGEDEDGDGGRVRVVLEGGEEVSGDILLGCDGLHSVARRLYVEPERGETYSGKVVAYGFASVEEPGSAGMVRVDGRPAVVDTTMFTGRYGAILLSFFEPKRETVFAAAVMSMKDESGVDGRDGWKTRGADKAYVEGEVRRRYGSSSVAGLAELLERVDGWSLYPVYTLPPGGRWSRGRVLLLGDAAHAMAPMGESIGVAIEDGALIARVLTRHRERSVSKMFADYETLRRPTIDKIYKELTWRWDNAMKEDLGWLWSIFWEWLAVLFLWVMPWTQDEYFARDVATIELPA